MKLSFKKILDDTELYIMFVLMIVFLINIFLQVFSRMLFKPLSFTEELSRYSFLWMVMLGFSRATHKKSHIRVTVLVNRFGPKAQVIVNLIIDILAVCLFVWLLYMGCQYVVYTAPTKTAALQISRGYVAVIVPVCSVLTIIRSSQNIAMGIKALKSESEGGQGV